MENTRLGPEVGVLGRGVVVAARDGGVEDGDISVEMFGADGDEEAAGVRMGDDDVGLEDADG